MKRKIIFGLLAMLLPLTGVAATASLSIDPSFDIKAGEEKEMVINLSNPDDVITLVQFDLSLPAGLSIKTVGGEYDIDIAERTTWRKHSLDANAQADGSIRFLLASSSNTALSGSEGAIIKMTLVANNSFAGGDIKLKNILMVTPEEKEITQSEYTYYVDPTPVPPPTQETAKLSIEPFEIAAGGETEMVIDLSNPDDVITLVQFDLSLPAGLSIKTVGGEYDIDIAERTTWRKHSLDANAQADGTIRFLMASSSNTALSGSEGAIIKMTLVANNSFTGGDVKLKNILMVTPEEKEIAQSTITYSIDNSTPVPPPTPGTAKLSIEPFSIPAGGEAEMVIDLTNPDDVITLVQFDLSLPAGLSIKKVDGEYDIDIAGRTTWKKHSLDANAQTDGSIRFLMASSSNTALSGTEGAIIKMTIVADGTFMEGDIKLDNILLVTPEEKEITPVAVTYIIIPNNPDDPELEAPTDWIAEISNGNLAGDNVANYVAKEYPSTTPAGAAIVAGAGKNGSRGIVVKSQDKVDQAWDTQFWINLNETLPFGTKLHVEFDYKADKAGSVSTQSHAAPGAYLHWAAIGSVAFTEEWQHYSVDVDVPGEAANMQSIAFNLNDIAEANTYYFDNFGVWVQKPAPVEKWADIIVNGNMEGESMECFYVTEQGVGGPFVAMATDGIGKDGGKAVKVQSADNPANNWDSQFFIRLPYQLPAGIKYRVTFDYKADNAGDFETQAHTEPGGYIHWTCIGSGNFATEWQTYEKEGTISSDMSQEGKPMQTIAFNLALNQKATTFIFDNVKFEVDESVLPTLTKNPAVDPTPYPVPPPILGTAKLSIEEPFSIPAGGEAEMVINLTNPDDVITLVQFDLSLPAGLSIKKVDGDYDIDIAERTTWKKHSLDANTQANGTIRFLMASSSNTALSGTEGAIIKMTLVADGTFNKGDIKLDNILLVTPEEKEIAQSAITYSIDNSTPVPPPTPGTSKLSIEPFSIAAGGEAEMVINLTNPDDVITLVQFDLSLPAGLSIKKVDGDYDIDIAGRTTWKKHSLDANAQTDGSIRFLMASSSNTALSGTEGAIIKMTLIADNSFTEGDIKLDNILLVTPEEKESQPEVYTYHVVPPIKDDVTLTAKSYTRVYGDANPTFEFTVSEGTITSGEPAITCSATAKSPVGTYDIVISKGTVSNGKVNLVNGKLTITKAPLTVKAGSYTRQEGEENPTFTLTYEGFKNGETEEVLTQKPVATTTATKDSPVGVYDIVVSGGEAQNYELIYVGGKLTVTVPSSIADLIRPDGTFDVYTLTGQPVRLHAKTLKGLSKGVYLINGKKLMIK